MRKVITLLLTIAMALSLVVVASAAGTGNQSVYLKTKELKEGNTITYTFSLYTGSSDGVAALDFTVETKGLTATGEPNYNVAIDEVFKSQIPGTTAGDYSFNTKDATGYFLAYGGYAETGRLLKCADKDGIWIVSQTYTIDSENYELKVTDFNACRSGDDAKNSDTRYNCVIGDVMKGDVNGDGNINIFDALMILQHIKGDIDLSDVPAADVNGDGNINIFDALMILQHIKGDIDLTA